MASTGRNYHALTPVDLAGPTVDFDVHGAGLRQHELMKVVIVQFDLARIRTKGQ